jgi:hypothetical protein
MGKRPFSNPTFFDLSENWHYLSQKASQKKTTGLPTFRFSMISPSFIHTETCV